MTPKEKAKELLEKMDVIHYVKLSGKNKDSKGLPVSMHDDQIKQCALMAVDEILKIGNLSNGWAESCSHMKLNSRQRPYWEEVKYEVENSK